MNAEIHAGDTTPFVITIKDHLAKIVSVAEATLITLRIRRPDLTVVQKIMELNTTGLDGKVKSRFEDTDLNQEGKYHYQVWVAWGTDIRHSKIVPFDVVGNI